MPRPKRTARPKQVRPKALLTVVWQYGCKPPDMEGRVIEQMRLANRYRSRLCNIEHLRREAVHRVTHDRSSVLS